MAGKRLQGMKIAFLVPNDGIERNDLERPWRALSEEGAELELVAPKTGKAKTTDDRDRSEEVRVDRATSEASSDGYDALVLPGAVADPDQLRVDPAAVALVRSMFEAGKPVAVIWRGPCTLVGAGLVQDRTLTSRSSMRQDIDDGVMDGGGHRAGEGGPDVLVTGPGPDDLDAFCKAAIDVFSWARAA